MQTVDYLLLGGLILSIGGIILYLVKRKKQGKGGCGCNCAGCPSKGACQGQSAPKKENTNDEAV